MDVFQWPGKDAPMGFRQWPTIERLAGFARAHPSVFAAAVLVGSFAAGRADPLSDVDLIRAASPHGRAGRMDVVRVAVDGVWSVRRDRHGDSDVH
jgi:hypothetical protein